MEEIVERYSVKQNWRMELIKGTDLARLQESAGNMVGQVQAFCERMREVKPFWGMMAHWLGVMQVRRGSFCSEDCQPRPMPDCIRLSIA